eukprot:Skav215402  [mRNA]  locus=scaffold271:65165:69367:- [translate_table: standard]
MDSHLSGVCPGSSFSLVASLDEELGAGVYRCCGISPKQEFKLQSPGHMSLGAYTLYDLVRLPEGHQADCIMSEHSQANRHEDLPSFNGFTAIDFCSGMGGFAIGSHMAGMKTGLFIECSELACKALRDNFDAHVIQGDLHDEKVIQRAHSMRPAGHIQVNAGFPCQPYSRQGDGKGLQDIRGTTLYFILRGAWLLNAQALLLECVANVTKFQDVQILLSQSADAMDMACSRMTFDLKDQWPMHRNRGYGSSLMGEHNPRHRLVTGGARGFGLLSANSGLVRHFHPEEACLLCTVPVDYKFDMPPRSAFCLLGQLAAPLQVLWIQADIQRQMELACRGSTTIDPGNLILCVQRDLLRQAQCRWKTARMWIPRSIHVELHGHVTEIQVSAPIRAEELLAAERKLHGWGQYPVMHQSDRRVLANDLLHEDVLYHLEIRQQKHIHPCPVSFPPDLHMIMGNGHDEVSPQIDGLGDKLLWKCIMEMLSQANPGGEESIDKFFVTYPFRAQLLLDQWVHERVLCQWKLQYETTMGHVLLEKDELQLHMDFLRLQSDDSLIVAFGIDDTQKTLASILHEKGVPADQSDARARQVMAKLGHSQVQQILQAKNVWAALKAAANKPGVMFRLVTADELARFVATRAKTQFGSDIKHHKAKKKASPNPLTAKLDVDPSKLVLDAAYRKNEEDEQVSQISFTDVEADQRGIALCTSQQAFQFLENPRSISVDALALLLVDHPSEEVIKSAGLQKIMFPAYCPGTDEHTVLFGFILQLGDGKVSRKFVGAKSTPEVVTTGVIKIQVFKDQLQGDWARFAQSPIRALVQMMDALQLCRGRQCGSECPKFHASVDETIDGVIFEVWARTFFNDKGARTEPQHAVSFTAFLRTPQSAIKAILTGTPAGVYAEPRGSQPKQHDQTYKVIWLPGDSFDEAMHKCRTCSKSVCLVRMRTKYGIRVHRDDEAQAWAFLRPGIEYVNLEVAKIYELCPVPHGTQRQTMVQLLKDWNWNAKPLQPGRGNFSHMSWRVGAAGPPPFMVMQGFDLDIVISPIKDLTPHKYVPKIIASHKTQKHLSLPSSSSQTASSSKPDPWQNGKDDPWAKFVPQSGNAGKTRLEAIQTQLCSDVTAKVRRELETQAAQMEVDGEDKSSSNDKHESRFQALEVGMTELRQQNDQFMQWFHEAGERMQTTEQKVGEIHSTLTQHQNEIQGLGHVFKSTVATMKDDLSQEMSSNFSAHMNKLETLLDLKRLKNA